MAEMKYKIGDHVVIENSNVDDVVCCYAGRTGVVKEYWRTEGGFNYLIAIDNEPLLELWCNVKCLVEDKPKKPTKKPRKFKVGDKVRITGDYTDATDHLDGKIGTVVRVRDNDIEVTVDDNKFPWLIWNCNAELVTEVKVNGFKVGDRVTVDGMNGTIICITLGDIFGVQFDDEDYDGHRCLGVKLKAGKPSTKNNCWWVNPENVTRYEEPKYYNGKVVCVESTNDSFTVGKIYTFVDGTVVDNRG